MGCGARLRHCGAFRRTHLSPIQIAADGTVAADTNGTIFTGATATNVAGTVATTCNNRSTNSASSSGATGCTNLSAGTAFFNNGPAGCDTWQAPVPIHVYCLQQ